MAKPNRTELDQYVRTGIIGLILLLSACVSPVDYGSVRHSEYVADDRCNPKDTDASHASGQPYFFVTSRLPDCRSTNLKLINHRGDRVRFGRFAEPGLIPDEKGKQKPGVKISITNQAKWWNDLSTAMAKGDGRILLYVHGYRETFYSSSRDAAQMARLTNFNGPIIQYSWPSQGQFLKYAVDETNMYWDERNFRNFLMKLAQAEWTKEIVLVSHSLGARLVVPAVEYVDENSSDADSSNISNIILASPDIDRQNFERDVASEILAMRRVQNNRRITIYTSAKDKALGLSADIHGYPRLGSPRCFDPFKAAELKAMDLPERCYAKASDGLIVVDTSAASAGGSGHSDYLRSAAACTDFAKVVNGATGSIGGRNPTHLSHVFTLPAPGKGEKPDHMQICQRQAS